MAVLQKESENGEDENEDDAYADDDDIAIEDENNQSVGFLKPITKNDIDNVKLLQTLTKWRSDNMEMFMTNFTATTEMVEY